MKLKIYFFLTLFLPGALSVSYACKLIVASVHLSQKGVSTTGIITGYKYEKIRVDMAAHFAPSLHFLKIVKLINLSMTGAINHD
jgi:hypothetical protein